MTAFTASLEKLSAATTAAEYLAIQSECLASAKDEEALQIARTSASTGARRRDVLQILYWRTSQGDRVNRFQNLLEESATEEQEFLKALLFRAVTERTVRGSHPDCVVQYLKSVREEFAKSLFVS